MFVSSRIRESYQVYPQCRVPFEELEREHNRPIRILSDGQRDPGGASPAWHSSHVNEAGFSFADGRDRGLTLLHRAPPHGVNRLSRFTVTYNGLGPQQEFAGFTHQPALYNTNPPMPVILQNCTVTSVGNQARAIGINETTVVPIIGEIVGPREVLDYNGVFTNTMDGWWIDSMIMPLVEALRLSCTEDLSNSWEAIQAQRREQRFVDFCTGLTGSRTEELRKSIDAQIITINRASAEIIKATRKADSDNELLTAILSGRSGDDNRLQRDFEMLKEHPRVESIEFINDRIVIMTTDDLRIINPDNGDSRWLGQFKIEIGFGVGTVQLFNMSTPRYDRAHPHVNVSGEPCFGGHQNDIAALLKRGDLYTLFEILLQYLETLNTSDSWGSYGAYWFDVPDERPLESTDTATEPQGVVAA
jgi:hypothetical protein